MRSANILALKSEIPDYGHLLTRLATESKRFLGGVHSTLHIVNMHINSMCYEIIFLKKNPLTTTFSGVYHVHIEYKISD